MRNFDGHATLLFGILIGLALGLVVGMWPPPWSLRTTDGCEGLVFVCWLDRWQTLVSGLLALSAAVLAWQQVRANFKSDRERLHRLETASTNIMTYNLTTLKKVTLLLAKNFEEIFRRIETEGTDCNEALQHEGIGQFPEFAALSNLPFTVQWNFSAARERIAAFDLYRKSSSADHSAEIAMGEVLNCVKTLQSLVSTINEELRLLQTD